MVEFILATLAPIVPYLLALAVGAATAAGIMWRSYVTSAAAARREADLRDRERAVLARERRATIDQGMGYGGDDVVRDELRRTGRGATPQLRGVHTDPRVRG